MTSRFHPPASRIHAANGRREGGAALPPELHLLGLSSDWDSPSSRPLSPFQPARTTIHAGRLQGPLHALLFRTPATTVGDPDAREPVASSHPRRGPKSAAALLDPRRPPSAPRSSIQRAEDRRAPWRR